MCKVSSLDCVTGRFRESLIVTNMRARFSCCGLLAQDVQHIPAITVDDTQAGHDDGGDGHGCASSSAHDEEDEWFVGWDNKLERAWRVRVDDVEKKKQFADAVVEPSANAKDLDMMVAVWGLGGASFRHTQLLNAGRDRNRDLSGHLATKV